MLGVFTSGLTQQYIIGGSGARQPPDLEIGFVAVWSTLFFCVWEAREILLKGVWIDWWLYSSYLDNFWCNPIIHTLHRKWTVGQRVRLATLKRYLKQNNVSKVITKQLGTRHHFPEMFCTQEAMLCYEEYQILVDIFLFGDLLSLGIPRKPQSPLFGWSACKPWRRWFVEDFDPSKVIFLGTSFLQSWCLNPKGV